MMWIQIFGSVFLLFAISRVVLRWRDHQLSVGELILWLFVFGGILAVVLVPWLTSAVASFVGIGRGADVVIYGSVALLFYLMFRAYVHLENIEYRLTQLVRELALAQSRELSPTERLSLVEEESVSAVNSGGKKQSLQ